MRIPGLKSVLGFTSVLGAAGLAALMSASAVEAQTFRYSQWIPTGHFTQKNIMHPWLKEIEKATDGRVKIQPTAKALGAPPRQYQLAKDGISDLSWGPHGYTPGVHPLSEMAELPFITKSTEANSVAYWRVFKKYLQPAGMHKGVHTLGVHVHPAGHLYNNKRKVTKLEDLKGIKFRIPNRMVSEALKIFGAVPVAGSVTQLRNGLAKGVYDGSGFTDDAVIAFKITKFVKYVTRFPGGLYNTSFYAVMNQRAWDKISAGDKKIVMNLSGEAFSKRMGGIWDQYDAKAPAQLKADGATFQELTGDALAAAKSKLAGFEANWLAKASKKGVDGVAALKMFRAEVAAHGS